jgi:uncharacterized membrane protein (DUF106 family)
VISLLVSPHVDIALISLALALVSQFIQRVVFDKKGMQAKQKEMKEKSTKARELMKKGDDKSMKQMEELNKEIMESMSTMMSGSFKMMAVMFIVYMPVLWYLPEAYSGTIDLPIPLPWLGGEGQGLIAFTSTTNWLGWYFISAMVFSLGLNAIINLVGKVRGAKK